MTCGPDLWLRVPSTDTAVSVVGPATATRHSGNVPNLDFYAVDDDRLAVLDAVFGLGLFRVFESYSEPDRELREFRTTSEVPDSPRGRFLALFVVDAGPEPTAERIEFDPGAVKNATFRSAVKGGASFSCTSADGSRRRSCGGAIPTTTPRSVRQPGPTPFPS